MTITVQGMSHVNLNFPRADAVIPLPGGVGIKLETTVDEALVRLVQVKDNIKNSFAIANEGRPRLVAPDANALPQALGDESKISDPSAMLVLLISRIEKILSTDSFQTQFERLTHILDRQGIRDAELQLTVDRYEKLIDEKLKQTAALRSASQEVSDVLNELKKANFELTLSRERLKQVVSMEIELANLPLNSLEYFDALKRLDDVKRSNPDAQQSALIAERQVAQLKARLENGSHVVVNLGEVLLTKNNQLAELDKKTNLSILLPPEGIVRNRSVEEKIDELMALLSEVMANVSENDLKEKLHIFNKQLEAQQLAARKKSDEYEARVAEEKKKRDALGIFGKIMGWLLAIASLVAGVFTGGATLIVAVAMVAVLVAEEAGFSLMKKIMDPLMENVIKPLIKLISKAIEEFNLSMGVDSETARLRGTVAASILSVLLVVAVIVAAVLVTKGAAGKSLKNFT
ncbi:type III secretion system translocon subunit SctE, partial [Herbaspirillum sp. RTI4]